MKQGKSIIIVVATGSLLIAVLLGLHIAILSRYEGRCNSLHRETNDLRRRLENDHIATCLVELRQIAAQRQHLVPEEESVSHVVNQIAHDLTELGVSDRSMGMKATRQVGEYVEHPVSATFRCTLAEVHEFARRLRDKEHLVAVERLAISRKNDAGSDDLDVDIDLVAFGRRGEDSQ